MEAPAMYIREGDAFVGTVLTQGPWHPGHSNGGSVLALLGHVLEDVPSLTEMTMARFTADLMRPVPVGKPLHVVPTIVREGKKIQIVEMSLQHEGVECVRASVLRVRNDDLSDIAGMPPDTTTFRPNEVMTPREQSINVLEVHPNPSGALHAIDLLRAGRTDSDATSSWLRLSVPVVAGEEIRTTSRMTFAFDFTSLIGTQMNPRLEGLSMINPDVSAQVLRNPVGEWIAMLGDTRFHHAIGRGVSSATLADDLGVFAVTSTSQIVQYRRPD